MSLDRRPITLTGKKLLEKELRRLVHEERPKVIQAIEVARGHGDLSENADYDAAKDQQAQIEARIAEINGKLAAAQVIDISSIKSDKIIFGAYVVLQNSDDEKEVTYQIVGEDESDAKKGKLSVASPLGKKLIGKQKGDFFELKTPKVEREYTVIDFYFQ